MGIEHSIYAPAPRTCNCSVMSSCPEVSGSQFPFCPTHFPSTTETPILLHFVAFAEIILGSSRVLWRCSIIMKILLLFVLQSFIQSHESTNQIMRYVIILCWILSNLVTICLSSASPLQITWTKLKSLWSSWGSETANSQWGNKSIFHNLQKIFFSAKQEKNSFNASRFNVNLQVR